MALLLLALVVALAALTLGVWLIWRRRSGLARLRYPVVLVHGFGGFERVKVGPFEREYFRAVRDVLTSMCDVYVPSVPATASIAVRAEALASALRAIPAKKVNIIAHSMGGLDARYAIAKLGLARKVAALITIGTPHRGTAIAAASAALRPFKRVLDGLPLPMDALTDLTPARSEHFNAEVQDVPGLHYGCFLMRVSAQRKANPLLRPTHRLLKMLSGENDGLVPVSSQRWGEVYGEAEADHWAQIGWFSDFDAPAVYASIAATLRKRGF